MKNFIILGLLVLIAEISGNLSLRLAKYLNQ